MELLFGVICRKETTTTSFAGLVRIIIVLFASRWYAGVQSTMVQINADNTLLINDLVEGATELF